jgi:hypothetical protein
MFERFTGEARQVVVLAQEQARALSHDHIGTEHVLLALLAQADSPVARGLAGLGLTADAARDAVLEAVPRGTKAPSGHIPFTPRSKRVLEMSLRESLNRGEEHIGPEHLLLGILAEGRGVAARILLRDGRTAEAVREVAVPPGGRAAAGRRRTPAREEVLARAERAAFGAPVGTHHLLLALAASRSSMAGHALADLDPDGTGLVARLEALDIDDTTDSTPERRAAAALTWDVDGERATLSTTHPETVARLRALVEQAGGPLTGDGPLTGVFIGVHEALTAAAESVEEMLSPSPEPDAGSGAPARTPVREMLRRRRRG